MFLEYCSSSTLVEMFLKYFYSVLISKTESSHVANAIFPLLVFVSEKGRKLESLVSNCDMEYTLGASLCSPRTC